MPKIRVVLSVDYPSGRWPMYQLKTMIAAAITESVLEEVPGSSIHWTSLGGTIPEVVRTAEANGRSVRSQQAYDADEHWS